MSEKKQGTVKWFNNSKGFGFIDYEDKDYFVYFSSINMAGYKTLLAGSEVSFTPSETERGLAAVDVEPA